ncbi:TIGR02391 family protein [Nocardioides sp. NPDC000445]|uniref:TIGR02391 family protein n=1 Tax=Nocardioides sp. NPDC000445 TaxID=3154257 RepID=UPI003330EE50
MHLGQGLFSGIRNPLNHVGADDLTEQEALETLAAWSLFARWVDRAVVAIDDQEANDAEPDDNSVAEDS